MVGVEAASSYALLRDETCEFISAFKKSSSVNIPCGNVGGKSAKKLLLLACRSIINYRIIVDPQVGMIATV